MKYDTDIGYGIRVVESGEGRPRGFVVEIHFYDKSKAVACAAELIRSAAEENENLAQPSEQQ